MGYGSYDEYPMFREALAEVRAAREARRERSAAHRRMLLRFVDVALILAIGFTVFVGYGLADNRWYRIIAVEGESMRPTLVSGDAIVLTRPPAVLEPGMIVTLEVDGRVVTHRVVATDGSAFITRGDANDVDDDWRGVPVDVVGVQRARIPLLGRVLTFLAGITGSGAWQSDRVVVGGAAGGVECFGDCATSDAVDASTGDVVDADGDLTEETVVVGEDLEPPGDTVPPGEQTDESVDASTEPPPDDASTDPAVGGGGEPPGDGD